MTIRTLFWVLERGTARPAGMCRRLLLVLFLLLLLSVVWFLLLMLLLFALVMVSNTSILGCLRLSVVY